MKASSSIRKKWLAAAKVKAVAWLLGLIACTSAGQGQQTAGAGNTPPAAGMALVYAGTFAGPDSESIFLYRLDTATGALTRVSALKGGENPSYLVLDKQRRFLYAINEIEHNGRKRGAVSSFSVNPQTGDLTLLNRQSSSGGTLCHIALDNTEKTILVASYGEGSVTAFPVLANGQVGAYTTTAQHEGSGPNKSRQQGPHAHYIHPDPANRFAFAVDLGTDKIMGYRLDPERASFTPNVPAVAFTEEPGAGPRHMIFHPNGRYAYVINELNSTMTALAWNSSNGTFTKVETVPTIPAAFKENNQCAAVKVSADGKFLYGSNRGHNSIVVFAIDAGTGRLALVEHESTKGNWPRDFTLDLTGNFLLVANERSNNIVSYRIDKATGRLAPTGHEVDVPKPVCLQVVSDRQP